MKIKFQFTVGTKYVGSTVKKEVELEFDDEATDDEIEEEAASVYQDWLNNQLDGGWERLDK